MNDQRLRQSNDLHSMLSRRGTSDVLSQSLSEKDQNRAVTKEWLHGRHFENNLLRRLWATPSNGLSDSIRDWWPIRNSIPDTGPPERLDSRYLDHAAVQVPEAGNMQYATRGTP